MTIDKIVTTNILNLLRDKKISQAQLSRDAKISVHNLNRLLRGKRSITKSNVLPLIANALGVSQDSLMNLTPQNEAPAKPKAAGKESKEDLIAKILVRLSTLNEDQLRAASTGINNAILAATSTATLSGKKSPTGT